MERLIAVITFLSTVSCANWDTADKIMFSTSVALNAVDCLQTNTAIQNGREEGAMPIRTVAGATPTTNQIAAYAVTVNTLKYFIANALPGNYRKARERIPTFTEFKNAH